MGSEPVTWEVDPAVVCVAHPIQNRTDGEVRALADGAITDLLAALRDAST